MKPPAFEEPPTKAERQLCYNARDKYWACLDKNVQDEIICKEFRKLYTSACSSRWVDHFDKKYRFEKWKVGQDEEVKKIDAEKKLAEKREQQQPKK